jgi:hypothetical protein
VFNISDMEIGRSDYKIFRRDRHERGGDVFICMKIEIDCIFCGPIRKLK